MYKDSPIKEYLNDLAAKLPAPGGGSASALTAALAVALISMVANFTIGKPKYKQYEEEIKSILEKSEKLRGELLNLVDLDVVAYKSKNIKDCLDVPFMICRLCGEAIKLCPPLLQKGNVNLISDVGVAAVLLESAFVSAYFNVDINLKAFTDKELARDMKKELDERGENIRKIRSEMEAKVGEIIRG